VDQIVSIQFGYNNFEDFEILFKIVNLTKKGENLRKSLENADSESKKMKLEA
jgi:hypothetical protein